MSLETRSSSALFKRAEQLKRWEESDTNREPVSPKQKSRKIKFSSGCVFLAACAAGDKDEVVKLLEKGADINTANVDGLTALHQACIDDNLDMVEFLVEHGADVNRGDNEGWTPLHATASCGFLYIAKYLIEKGANVAAVNNDHELPIDIAESQKMEDLLKVEIEKRGIDCEAARNEEERIMLKDAKEWLATKSPLVNMPHPKTGATPLHVASAKGYTDIMKILLQSGADIDAQDVDGWTPIHAAAHWGLKEACQLLAESLADMNAKNFVGQTAFDLADSDMLTYLEDLKKKQNEEEVQSRRQAIKRPEIADRTLEAETPSKVKKLEVENSQETEAKVNEIVEQRNKDNVVNDNISSANKDKDVVNVVVKAPPTISPKRNVDSMEESPPWRKSFSKQNDSDLGSLIKTTDSSDLIGEDSPRKTNNLQNSEKSVREDHNETNKTPVSATTNTVSTDKSSPLASPQPLGSQPPLRRSFVPPVRDEESETQRKAHAKRVRETRRSTQGVTLEEIKSAEQFVKKKNQPNSNEPAKPDDATKPPSTPSYIRRTNASSNPAQRPSSAPTETAETTVTVTLRRPKSLEEKEQDKENDIRNAQATLATQAAIQRRRRPKRRSTGVVSFDNVDDLESEKELSTGGGDSVSSTKHEGGTERNSRSRISSTSDFKNENGDVDYKRLYEQQLGENDRLKEKLRKCEDEMRETRQTLERINAVTSKNPLSELEKRERRAMERKLSEMEEELKYLDILKNENQRLKDENGALIRVISKLSK